jgi:hypothetical protein
MPLQTVVPLVPAAAFLWVLLGILISLVLPVAVRTLKRASGLETSGVKPTLSQRVHDAWLAYGGPRYASIFCAAVVVAAVILLMTGLEFYKVRDAVFAGFAWESLVNKLFTQARKP